jgi:hypothetical protein
MASRADIEAGKAHILLYMKSTVPKALNDLKKGLTNVGTEILKVGGFLTGLGASITAPLAAAVAHFVSFGSTLTDMSARTGMAASSLAELKFAAEQTGAGLEDIEKAIMQMQKKGIHGTFDQVAKRIAAIQDPAKRTQAAIESWGKSGTKLLPMINDLAKLRQEARDLGLVPTDEAVAAADELGDAFDKVKSVGLAAAFEIGAALAPTLLAAAETIKTIVAGASEWVRKNAELVRTVAMLSAGLTVLGAAVTGVGVSLIIAGSAAGVLATTVGVLGSIMAAVLSPVGLVTAAIIGGIAAWAKWTESGQAAVGVIMNALSDLLAWGREVIGGIADAMMAGDLELAAKIGWAAVLVVWESAKLQMMKIWISLRETVLAVWDEMVIAGQTAIGFISGAFTGFLDQFVARWGSAFLVIEVGWNTVKTTGLAAFNAISLAVNVLIDRVRELFQGIVGVAKAIAPIAATDAKSAASGLNTALAASTGIDVNKIFSGAATGGIDANAQARAAADAARASRAAADDTALSDQEKRIRDRQAELDALIADAAAARARAEEPRKPGAAVEGVAAAGIASAGTFSAAALLALGQGGGSPQERTAKATEKMATTVEKLHKINESMLMEAKAARLAPVV